MLQKLCFLTRKPLQLIHDITKMILFQSFLEHAFIYHEISFPGLSRLRIHLFYTLIYPTNQRCHFLHFLALIHWNFVFWRFAEKHFLDAVDFLVYKLLEFGPKSFF